MAEKIASSCVANRAEPRLLAPKRTSVLPDFAYAHPAYEVHRLVSVYQATQEAYLF